jgi:hypothetical protein
LTSKQVSSFSVLELSESDLRLDRVAVNAEQRRLTESALFDRRGEAAECPIRFTCVSERELEEAQNREQLETGGPAAQLVRQFEPCGVRTFDPPRKVPLDSERDSRFVLRLSLCAGRSAGRGGRRAVGTACADPRFLYLWRELPSGARAK